MKYIIVKDQNDVESAIVFPNHIMHLHVARVHYVGEMVILSAGFCDLKTGEAWGKSESLDMQSRKEDSNIIKRDYA